MLTRQSVAWLADTCHGTAVHLRNNVHVHVYNMCAQLLALWLLHAAFFFFLQQQQPATTVFTAHRLYTIANALRVLHSSAFINFIHTCKMFSARKLQPSIYKI